MPDISKFKSRKISTLLRTYRNNFFQTFFYLLYSCEFPSGDIVTSFFLLWTYVSFKFFLFN